MAKPPLRTVPVLALLGAVLALSSGCPGKGPVPPKPVCNQFSEDDLNAPEHCSVDKKDCEKVLSKILYDAHKGRCPSPPCTGFSAWTVCKPTGRKCAVDEVTVGEVFETEEHLRCR